MPDFFTIVAVAASVVTGIGAVLVVQQIQESRRQFQTKFEDDLTREYRDIVEEIPAGALLGEERDAADLSDEELSTLYSYVDLTNQQVWHREEGRVSASTWANWHAGIRETMERPAFRSGWAEIDDRTPDETFAGVRRLLDDDYPDDPYKW